MGGVQQAISELRHGLGEFSAKTAFLRWCLEVGAAINGCPRLLLKKIEEEGR